MARIVLNFPEAESAECLVAGIPAAARAVREVAIAGTELGVAIDCIVSTGGGWTPSRWCQHELDRLGTGLRISIEPLPADEHAALTRHVRGDHLVPASAIVKAVSNNTAMPDGIFAGRDECVAHESGEPLALRLQRLRRAGRAIVKATGKAGDGPVSRFLNRPVSQAISRLFLQYPGMTPFVATCGTIAIAIAMALCLVFGGPAGIVWGGLLFHAASVFDGVDGEIARATFQTSLAGARLDSMTDAMTNIAFIMGLSFNIAQRGHMTEGAIGFLAVGLLGLGLYLLGQRAKARGGPYGFNAVKDRFNAKRSWWLTAIAQIAARDFFAFAFAASGVIGLAIETLMIFAFGAIVWFVVISLTLVRTRSDVG